MTDKERIVEMASDMDYACTKKDLYPDDAKEISKVLLKLGYHKTIWHKVADGDLPKNSNYVLVVYHYYSIISYAIACYKGQLNNFRKWSTTDDYFKYDDDVIAWTQLPEYKE